MAVSSWSYLAKAAPVGHYHRMLNLGSLPPWLLRARV
jgi:hypothetical protein